MGNVRRGWGTPSRTRVAGVRDEFSFVGEEHLYRAFFKAEMGGVLFTDTEGRVLEANAEACRLLGRGRDELLAPGAGPVFDPADPRLARAREEQNKKGFFRGPLRARRGATGSFEASVTVVDYEDGLGEERLVMVLADREEVPPGVSPEATESAEETYRSLAGYVGDMVFIFEADGTTRYASPSMERVLGFAPEEVVGTVTLDHIHPDDLKRVVANAAAYHEVPGVAPPFVYRSLRKDGSYAHLEAAMINLLHDQRVRGVVGVFRDVTERVRAEEEIKRLNEELERRVEERTAELESAVVKLKENERALEAAFEEAPHGIAHVSPGGRFLKVNGELCRVTGYERGELLGMSMGQVTHPEDVRKDEDNFRRLLSGALPGYAAEKRFLRKDGAHTWVSLNVSPSDAPEGEPERLIVVVEDIDARKRAELALGSLTRREKEVLALLARGRTNPQISGALFISPSTIRYHIQNVVEKLGVRNRTAAATRAIELGLLAKQ